MMRTVFSIFTKTSFWFCAFAFLITFASSVFALSSPNDIQSFQNNVYGDNYNLDSHAKGTLDKTLLSLTLGITGCDEHAPCSPQEKSGAVGATTTMIATLYSNPPASGVTYFADVFKNLGIAKPAYAQTGTGFVALQPVLPLWRAFRNLTYVLFIIVMVIVGFAIMFRFRLSPQTVITIQSALPRMIIGLIFVTFSYAIAGLLIDFGYLIFFIVIGALGQWGAITTNQQNAFINDFVQGGFFDTVVNLIKVGLTSLKDAVGGILPWL